ncbi:MAG TPA: phosphoribosylformylglycinamidine synthase subunit PurL [Candidatus Thermoplasmatota archaeon]|nr:phosphoribosylformylglycinamidine synthase subunit PurL [Candidatus Thermoplasmatota archaeon]
MPGALEKRSVLVQKTPEIYEVVLKDASDDELAEIAKTMGIGLSADEMRRVASYFAAQNRNPRDIELEALGQAWSEHCCYKSSKPVLKRHVYGIHEDRLIAREDAGVMHFDGEWAYVAKIESHNHPSAIEPYGGAATGIGGVVRDVVCMGAQPIALIDPLFFGPLDTPYASLPAGTKHPKYLFGGVVAGIRDYGNRIGIPTVSGSIHFHPKFLTNCLVNVGCLGIMKKEHLIHSRVGNVGDVYVLLGGKTGRDGIHGVTFASADLAADADESGRSAVQLGDPITKEPLIHASLELNERRLLTGMKDLGGGGLSCVAGEMALDGGVGAEIHLDQVHLKASNMKPWEIWVSESQERMMVTCLPENVEHVLDVAGKWDVEARVVGTAIPEKRVKVMYNGFLCFDMDSEFLYGGPVYHRPMEFAEVAGTTTKRPAPREDFTQFLLQMLGHENVCSRESVIRQYDHEVRAATVVKPLQGKVGFANHGDAAVLKPVKDSWKGLAVTCDINPHMTDIDPYRGTLSGIDELVRNLASVGARLDSIADNLNLPNPQKPLQMGRIEKAAMALGDGARALRVPFISGNVSMYNESAYTPIPVTPTLLGVGIVNDIRKCVTTDLKQEGHALYHVGELRDEMGGSHYFAIAAGESTQVPSVDIVKTKKYAEGVVTAIEKGIVAACHDVSLGGLAVTLAEMCMGGDVGASVDLRGLGNFPSDVKLFSESNTRWVVEARDAVAFEGHMRALGIPCQRIGVVGGDSIVVKDGPKALCSARVADARKEHTEAFHRRMA